MAPTPHQRVDSAKRAIALFNAMWRLRTMVKRNGRWNVLINLNDHDGCPSVKVLYLNQVVRTFNNPDHALYQHLQDAARHIQQGDPTQEPLPPRVNRDATEWDWYGYPPCHKCAAAQDEPCIRRTEPSEFQSYPHEGRMKVRG